MFHRFGLQKQNISIIKFRKSSLVINERSKTKHVSLIFNQRLHEMKY